MVAIKDMAIPSRCDKCFFKGYSECLLTKTFIIDETRRAENCPLVEIEPLTDSEQRIFLSAMSREMSICKQIDNDKVDDSTVKKLVPIVNTIERKIKKVLWN